MIYIYFGLTIQHVGSQFLNQGLNPWPPIVEVQGPNCGTIREVPSLAHIGHII